MNALVVIRVKVNKCEQTLLFIYHRSHPHPMHPLTAYTLIVTTAMVELTVSLRNVTTRLEDPVTNLTEEVDDFLEFNISSRIAVRASVIWNVQESRLVTGVRMSKRALKPCTEIAPRLPTSTVMISILYPLF